MPNTRFLILFYVFGISFHRQIKTFPFLFLFLFLFLFITLFCYIHTFTRARRVELLLSTLKVNILNHLYYTPSFLFSFPFLTFVRYYLLTNFPNFPPFTFLSFFLSFLILLQIEFKILRFEFKFTLNC